MKTVCMHDWFKCQTNEDSLACMIDLNVKQMKTVCMHDWFKCQTNEDSLACMIDLNVK